MKTFTRTAPMLMLAALAGSAAAQPVLFSNLGPGGTFSNGGNFVQGENADPFDYQGLAGSFTPTNTAVLGSIDLALFNNTTSGGGPNDTVIVQLFTSNAEGIPGTLIEELGTLRDLPDVFTSTTALRRIESNLNPVLSAGTEYWVAVVPASDTTTAVWNSNTTGDRGIFVDQDAPGATFGADLGLDFIINLPAFRVNAVPTPGTAAVLGVVGLLGGRRRR